MATQSYSKPPYSPTRFPAGITNANAGENLGNLGQPDPTKFETFFEDFITPPAALGTFTAIAGPGGLATVATTNAVDTPTASFVLDPTKRFFFKSLSAPLEMNIALTFLKPFVLTSRRRR